MSAIESLFTPEEILQRVGPKVDQARSALENKVSDRDAEIQAVTDRHNGEIASLRSVLDELEATKTVLESQVPVQG